MFVVVIKTSKIENERRLRTRTRENEKLKSNFKHEKTYISSEAKSIPTTQDLEKKDLNIQSR